MYIYISIYVWIYICIYINIYTDNIYIYIYISVRALLVCFRNRIQNSKGEVGKMIKLLDTVDLHLQ